MMDFIAHDGFWNLSDLFPPQELQKPKFSPKTISLIFRMLIVFFKEPIPRRMTHPENLTIPSGLDRNQLIITSHLTGFQKQSQINLLLLCHEKSISGNNDHSSNRFHPFGMAPVLWGANRIFWTVSGNILKISGKSSI